MSKRALLSPAFILLETATNSPIKDLGMYANTHPATTLKKLNAKKYIDCGGCLVDSPTQKGHMGLGGCLNQDTYGSEEWYGGVVDSISLLETVDLYHRVSQTLNITAGLTSAETTLDQLKQHMSVELLNSDCLYPALYRLCERMYDS